MHDESELAGVLAHEIGHIVRKDGLHAVQKAGLTSAMIKAGSTAAQQNAQLVDFLGKSTDTLLSPVYDKSQESGADKDAVTFLTAAGYDSHGLANFLERIDTKGGSLLSSHPPTPQRVTRDSRGGGGHCGGDTGGALSRQYGVLIARELLPSCS